MKNKHKKKELEEKLKVSASVAHRMCSIIIKVNEGEKFARPKWHRRCTR